jgi:PKD repeat protein/predicted esterase
LDKLFLAEPYHNGVFYSSRKIQLSRFIFSGEPNYTIMKNFVLLSVALMFLRVSSSFAQFPFPQTMEYPNMDQPGYHVFQEGSGSITFKNNIRAYKDSIEALMDTLTREKFFQKYTYRSMTHDTNGIDSLPFLMAAPKDYDSTASTKYPLVIYFHGVGGVSTSLPPDVFGFIQGLMLPSNRERYKAFLMSPRFPSRASYWSDWPAGASNIAIDSGVGNEMITTPITFILKETIDSILANNPHIDPNRIYIGGHSHGGHTTAQMAANWTETFAFASVNNGRTRMGRGFPTKVGDKLPFWNINGDRDGTVNPKPNRWWHDSLIYHGNLDMNLWWVKGLGHSPYYQDNNRELLEYMFKQTRENYINRPEAVFSASALEGAAPLSINFDASASTDPDGSVVHYRWDFATSLRELGFNGDTLSGASLSTTSKTLDSVGTYYVRLVVTDNDGKRRASVKEITVYPANPQAQFTFTRNFERQGEPVQFDARTSMVDYSETISSFEWDFDDGNTGSGDSLSHVFTTTGNYDVRLIITSTSGRKDTLTRTVTITDKFPGYRYLKLRVTAGIFTWRHVDIERMYFKEGSDPLPSVSMTSNNAPAPYKVWSNLTVYEDAQNPYHAFADNGKKWEGFNYQMPNELFVDLGSGNKHIPTGMYLRSSGGQNRLDDYAVYGSNDKEVWDLVWDTTGAATTEIDITWQQLPSVAFRTPADNDTIVSTDGISISVDTINFQAKVDSVVYYLNGNRLGMSQIRPYFTLDTSNLTLGDYQLIAKGYNNGGEQSIPDTVNFHITSPPSTWATFTFNPEGSVPTGAIINFDAGNSTYDQTASSISSYTWNWDDGSPNGSGVTASHSFTSTGTYNVTLTILDDQGGTDDTTIVIVVEDPMLSSITINPAVANIDTSTSQAFSAEARDQFGNPLVPQPSFNWSVNGSGTVSGTGLYTAPGSSGGPYYVIVSATEGATTLKDSSEITVIETASICADSFSDESIGGSWSPIDYSSSSSISESGGQLRIQATSTSGISSSSNEFTALKLRLYGDFDVSVKLHNYSAFKSGTKFGLITATDLSDLSQGGYALVAGERWNGYTFETDLAGTAGELDDFSSHGSESEPSWVRLVKSANSFTAYYKTNIGDPWTQIGSAKTPQGTNPYSDVGLFMASIDGAGQSIQFDDFTINSCVATPEPALASFNFTPSSPAEGQSISFDASASAPASGASSIATYSWDWGDGSPNGSGENPSHSYSSSGTYNATLTITDDQANTDDTTIAIIVTAPSEPVASFTILPNPVITGESASFDASASAPASDASSIATYSWNWGDGSPSGTGQNPNHSYSTSGTYNVTLTITDDQANTDDTTMSIIVNDPVLTTLSISPADTTVNTGDVVSYSAQILDQNGNPLSPQPEVIWTASGGGMINSSGQFVAANTGATYQIYAKTSSAGITLRDTVSITLVEPLGAFCGDDFEDGTLGSDWTTIDRVGSSSVSESGGKVRLSSNGSNGIGGAFNEFVTIHRSPVSGDFDVSVKMRDYSMFKSETKAGIITATDLSDLSQGGYALVGVSRYKGFTFQTDLSGTVGEMDNETTVGSEVEPNWLRLVKSGATITAYYKTAEADPWTQIGATQSPQNLGSTSQYGLFVASTDGSSQRADFDDFNCGAGGGVTVTTWTGTNSSDWFDSGNWDNGLPDTTTNAIIPASPSSGNFPNVDNTADTARVRNLANEGVLTMSNDNLLQINGDLHNNGTFTDNGGKAQFVSASLQLISQSTTFSKVEIKEGHLALGQNTTIVDSLIFANGHLYPQTHSLNLGTAGISGHGENSYLVLRGDTACGCINREVGSSETEFPVGLASDYSPVRISNSGTAQHFCVKAHHGVYSDGYSGNWVATDALNRTFLINPSGTGADATIKIDYKDGVAPVLSGYNDATAWLMHYTAGDWYNERPNTGSGIQASDNTNPSLTGTYKMAIAHNVTGFSPFAPGNFGEDFDALPVDIISFEVQAVDTDAKLIWRVANERNINGYTIEKSLNGTDFDSAGFVTANGGPDYQFIDTGINDIVYYRLKISENEDPAKYSNTVVLRLNNLIENRKISIELWPNPVSDQLHFKALPSQLPLELQLIDATGRVLENTSLLNANSILNLKDLQSGIYIIHLKSGQSIRSFKIIKE